MTYLTASWIIFASFGGITILMTYHLFKNKVPYLKVWVGILACFVALGAYSYIGAPKIGDTRIECDEHETKKRIGVLNKVKYWEEYTECTKYKPKEVYGEDREWHKVVSK